jgi:hypothetical protein
MSGTPLNECLIERMPRSLPQMYACEKQYRLFLLMIGASQSFAAESSDEVRDKGDAAIPLFF